MKSILLVNNPNHVGISCVGQAYKKAFQFLGLDFNFLDFPTFPRIHNEQLNLNIVAHLSMRRYDIVIMIQPTYLYADTVSFLMKLKKDTQFYSIQTEDPYSVSAILQMQSLFDLKFTNEIVCFHAYENMGFRYLPMAFDSFLEYREQRGKEYDLTMQCNFYPNRMNYHVALKSLPCKKWIGGNIAYMAMKDQEIDATGFKAIGMLGRHKELELYSESKFVINPHRPPEIVGKSNMIIADKDCVKIFDKAKSPNPRFFDAIGAGAIPICDLSRSECLEYFRTYLKIASFPFALPPIENVDRLMVLLEKWDSEYCGVAEGMQEAILEYETYLMRAEYLLEEIHVD